MLILLAEIVSPTLQIPEQLVKHVNLACSVRRSRFMMLMMHSGQKLALIDGSV